MSTSKSQLNNLMHDTLIVEINNTLARFESVKHEILGNEFSYCYRGLSDNFNRLPPSNKKVAVLGASYVTDCFDLACVPAVDLSMFDLLIIFDQELLPGENLEDYLAMTRERFSIENVIIVTGAINQTLKLNTDKIFIFPLFLIEASYNYLYTETSTLPKLKLFDALLGIEKPHRTKIFNALTNYNLLDTSYVSMRNLNQSSIYCSDDIHDLEQAEAIQAKDINYGVFDSYQHTLPHPYVPYATYPISRQIPTGIYQNSYYSIVAETNYNSYIFFTEKTVKPLLAKRLFVMFSTHHHLKRLREYGFKTFSSIIDESYDDEIDDTVRMNKAIEQIVTLSKMDPNDVCEQIKDIVEHNHATINDRATLILPLRNWLLSHIL